MKKIIFMLVGLFIITGCTVNYNLSINDDLTINEQIKIVENEDFYKLYYKTAKYNAITGILDNYKDLLDEGKYSYNVEKTENPVVNIEKKYDDINSFLNNSKFFNGYFDEIKYNIEGNIVKIETIGFNPNEEDNPDRFIVEKLDVAIKCAHKVVNSNASMIDEDNNIYHFIMDRKTSDFKILLEFDKNSMFNPYMKKLMMIIISIIIIVGAWIGVLVFSKKNKKNS